MCHDALNNNLYVDNLIVTSNDVQKLADLHVSADVVMKEGGFLLREWNYVPANSTCMFSTLTPKDIGSIGEFITGFHYLLSASVCE